MIAEVERLKNADERLKALSENANPDMPTEEMREWLKEVFEVQEEIITAQRVIIKMFMAMTDTQIEREVENV